MCGVELALALRNEGQRCLPLAFTYRDLGFGAGYRSDRLLVPGARFIALRFEGLYLHVRQRLARRDEVAIGDQDILHTSAKLA